MSRTIDIGDVVSKVFRIYGQYASVLIPVAAVIFIIDAVFTALALNGGAALGLLASVVAVVLSTLYTGMVVTLVDDVRDGRLDHSVGGLFRSVAPVLLPLIAVSILAGLGIFIGLVLIIVPGLYLMTIWSVVSPVVVLERPGVFAAFGRSHQLVKGNGWQVFGVILLFFVIFFVIGSVLGVIGAALGDGGRVALNYVSNVITAPLIALAAAVLYFELRGTAPAGPSGGWEAPEAPRTPADRL